MEIVKTNDTELKKYNNITIIKKKELDEKEYDKEDLGYLMYVVTLENGKELQLFEDEIIKIEKDV